MEYEADTMEADAADEISARSAPPIGHNSGNNPGGIAAERLKSFVERLERLEEERKGIGEDMKDVFLELKSVGFDPKIVRAILKIRREDREKQREFNELKELYMQALGMDL